MQPAQIVNSVPSECEESQQTVYDRERLRELFRYFEAASRAVRGNPLDIDSKDGYDRIVPRLAADPVLNSLAQLGALQLNCQRAFISLIDDRNQYIVAETTRSISLYESDAHLPGDELCMGEVPLDLEAGVCAGTLPIFTSQTGRTINSGNILADQSRYVINDFTKEDLYKNRPYVAGFPHMRYYAEVPLRTNSGYVIGSYCVVDDKPRAGLDDRGFQVLTEISSAIIRHLDLIKTNDDHVRSMRLLDGLHNFVHGDSIVARQSQVSRGMSSRLSPGASDSGVKTRTKMSDRTIAVVDGASSKHTVSPTNSTTVFSALADRVVVSSELAAELKPSSSSGSSDTVSPSPSGCSTLAGSGITIEKASLGNALPKPATKRDSDKQEGIHDKAASILRSAMDLEGVCLLDASTNSVQSRRKLRSNATHVEVESKDSSQAHTVCRGYSFRASSVDSVDETSHNEDNPPSLPKHIQQIMIRKFPRGQIFTLDDAGTFSHTETLERRVDSTQQDRLGDQPINATLVGDADLEAALRHALPEATSIAFIPLWDPHSQGWTLTILAWTVQRTRVLLVEELSYCRAFGSTVLAELIRVELEATNRAKSDFISSISHELRSPLHGILASSDFLRDMSPSLDQSQMIDMIENCTRTLLDTVNHILSYSKINSLRRDSMLSTTASSFKTVPSLSKSSTLSTFDLSLLMEEIVDSSSFGHFHGTSFIGRTDSTQTQKSTSYSLEHKTNRPSNLSDKLSHDPMLTVTITLRHESTWLVHSDEAAWRRIISNLIGNSLKYTSSGLIDVSLSLEDEATPATNGTRRLATLTVSDTGRGMSPTYLQNHIFTPFTQEDSLSGGIGLGLSIVRTLIQSMDGSIHVDSELDKGTEIKVDIPVETVDGSSERLSEYQKFSGRSVCLYTRASFNATSGRRATINAFKSQAKEWLQMDILEIERLSSVISNLVVILEDDFACFNGPGYEESINDLPAHSCILMLCSLDSQFSTLNTTGGLKICTLTQPFGPQKLMKSLTACYDSLETSGRGLRRSRSSFEGAHHEPTKKIRVPSPALSPRSIIAATNDASDNAYESRREKELGLGEQANTSPKPNVLLVDDNAINLRLLTVFAKKLKCTYVTATNGLEAVEAYKKASQQFDFILMDLSMPVMDGFAATSAIRDHERENNLRACTVIALTGLGSLEAQQEAAKVGINTFMAKPVRLKELEKIMNMDATSSNMAQKVSSLKPIEK